MKTFVQQFQDIVKSNGERTALVYQNERVTYRQLDELSGRIAARLLERGAEKEKIYPIVLERGIDYIASEIGILKAGAAFSPLSVEYPKDRVDYIQKDCACDFLIDAAFMKEARQCQPLTNLPEVSWNDAAMVIYTSGSTGNPKGIVHEHFSFTRAIIRQLPVGCKPDGVEMSVTPFNFAISVADIFVPLWVGAPIHILSEQDRKDIYTVDGYIDAHGITASVISPQLLKRLPDRKSTLTNICCGGERISNIYKEYQTIYNSYGLSETLSIAIAFALDKPYDNTPIGKPLEDFTVYLLDEEGRQVKEGEEGEICIAGPLARGYINLPGQTAKTFVENPYASGGLDRRMLHTNDVGKRLPDGNILYVNRKDWMVKVNGQRVEMGEVEIQLGKIDGIETAVVKSFEDDNGQTYLCGYYLCGRPVAEDEIREKLAKKFPGYMIPRFLVQVDKFPLNANGKLDRKALAPPEASRFKKEYAAPENEVQEQICKGFEKVLGLSHIGIRDDFFSIGGDSIKVVILQEELSGLNLSSSAIFEGRTPEKIALSVSAQGGEENRYAGMDTRRDAYPMTDSQLGIYLECMREPESLMYNNLASFLFPRDMGLDPYKLRDALTAVIEGFPFMKIHVEEQNGVPCIIPNETLTYEIPVRRVDSTEPTALAKSFFRPFSLEAGPMFRFEIDILKNGDVLLLGDMHHIITDGTSTALFFSRMAMAYEGAAPEPELVDSFMLSNYELGLKGTREYKESREFFDSLLAAVEADSNLLPDEPFQTGGEKGCSVELLSLRGHLPIALLREQVKRYGITESTLFLGAFSYALAKQNGQDEVLFCTVDNGRHTPDLRGTMGMLVRTLPFYARIDEEKEAKRFLQETQDQLFQCIKHDSCSFVELASDYGVKSDIIFVYQGDTLNGITLGGRFVPMQIHKMGDSMANLSLDVLKRDDDYTLSFEYRSGLYTPRTIQQFAKLLVSAVKGFLAGGLLKDIPLCGEDDLAAYKSFNENTVAVDRGLTLVDLFRKQAAETPERNAVVYRDKTLTYRRLDELSEKLAYLLAKEGVGPEVPVGLMVRRSEIFPVCSFGIQKAGGACQPLDSNYPQERLQYMLEDSGAPVVVMDEELRELLPGYKGRVIYTKDIEMAVPDATVRLQPPKAENLFALLYTSGSTGKPKGCMIEHRNIVNFCLSFQKKFGITCEDRATAYGSFGFDASMQDLYPYLTKGACVYIVPEETRLDLPGLHELVTENKITMMDCTTQLGRQYVCAYPDSPTLRGMSVGGEKLVPCTPPGYPFYNTYGPTECTIYVTDFLIDRDYASVPIGRPFGNCDVYIVDKYRRLLPPGVPGELCIAGCPVTRGYLNRPDLTEEKYIDNPFNSTPGYEKMYLTGDVCRYLYDGNIQFVGRRDEQVKIRGFRIELTEIERRIRAFDGITDACVVARDLPAGGKAVVAYVVSDNPVDIPALNAFIAQELPRYMVPSVTARIDKIPLNPNGKVDKRRLPEPEMEAKKSSNTARPLNRLEQELKNMAAEITGQSEFDMEASLIAAGLSSLSAMMLASRVYERFGCRLNVAKLLEEESSMLDVENTVLDGLLAREQKKGGPEERPQQGQPAELPLSSAQLGVFYDCMKRPNAMIYNIPMMFTFSKQTDAQRLARAARAVIGAHPVLTAHLIEKEETVVQVLSGAEPSEPAVLQMAEDGLAEEKKSFARPFDLFEGPLYRMEIVKTPERTALLMDTHHIVFDGLSMSVFLEELRRAYETGKPAGESATFFDAAREENKILLSPQGKEAEDYYDKLFERFENASDIPGDLQGKEEDGTLGECVSVLGGEEIDDFCRANSVTPAALFLSGTFYAVSRYTADRNVYISMICSGRENGMYQDAFGMFVKTLPLYSQVTPGTDAVSFIKSAGKAMRSAIEHSAYPFVKRSGQYGYAPQINYACQLGVDAAVTLEGEPIREEVLTNPLPKFHISIHIESKDGAPAVCVQYNDALYSRAYMQQFADAIAQAVRNMTKAPGNDIAAVSLLSNEQQALIERFGMGETACVPQRLLHKLMEAQARENPEKTALIACDGAFSYAQFNRLSNRIANALVQMGVTAGCRVALLLPRTSRLLLSMYGVLKAGAAFIPCDPEYPQERISYILSDSAASFILTTKERAAQLPRDRAIDVETLLTSKDAPVPEIPLQPDDLAYLIYTSGSTGRPKGVMLAHGGITNYVYGHPANIHISALRQDAHTMVSVTTASFDMSLKETVAILSSGLTLALASEQQAQNPAQLAGLFKQVNGDAFNATPSRMEQYLELPAFRDALAGCRVVMCGGEKYSPKLLARLKDITGARIFNTYGPTEITVSCNACELTGRTEVTVGRPLLNVREFIVDCDGNPLPWGVTGELLVGGAGVARGYWNNEELTRKHFTEYRGMRVYRTGDYAKWTQGGDVAILGRTDNQVKLRGLRIELGEIEKCMLEDSRVRQAVVMIREINGTEHLCAYFTADGAISPQEMKETLGKALTAYMVPTAYLQLERLPVTPNGKVDVKKLPAPVPAHGGEFTAPVNDTEKALCEIFAQTLQLGKIGATDSFFDLGGTSLTVTNVLIKANERGFAVSYGDVFTCKTPRALAQKLLGGKDEQGGEMRYDYSRIDKILEENTLEALKNGARGTLGNLLLTGATGFLGIHILHEFLEKERGEVTCLLRGLGNRTAKMRLQVKLFYYFEDNYEEQFGKRIHLVEGDVTQTGWMEGLKGKPIHTVVNCAALVKHFSNQTDIEDVNAGGAENLLAFCRKTGAMMVQVSTGSIAGDRVDGYPSRELKLSEQKLYFGQNIDNQYVHSKFMAERLVLEAALQGVPVKIMRVGNLAARESDGEFQLNFTTNGFMGRLKAYLVIGAFPYSAMNAMVEMAPVDSTAQAILMLCKTPKQCRVFHPYNNHYVPLGDIILQMRRMGMKIELVEDEAFEAALQKAKEDPVKARVLTTLLAYENMDTGKKIEMIATENELTTQALYRLGFEWSMTSRTYMNRFLEALDGLGFFDMDSAQEGRHA